MNAVPFAATLTSDQVRDCVSSIAEVAKTDPEKAHGMEDDLHRQVLIAIATSTIKGNDALLAALYAVQTDRIEFPRWCA